MTSNGKGGGLGHGYYLEDLSTGMEATVSKTITDDDVQTFAGLSGDINPVHLDDDFAAGTIFKKRIAHGFLTGSLFSTAAARADLDWRPTHSWRDEVPGRLRSA